MQSIRMMFPVLVLYLCAFPVRADVNWQLAWSDEFDGTTIDTSVWRYEIGFIRNNELQYYTNRPENARVENGNLVLEARKDNWEGHEYTSASLNTHGTLSWKYGRIEMRAKLVQGKGMWPAFWAMGESGTWPGRGELDIMEMIGGGDGYDNVTHGTLHWDDDGHKSSPGLYKIPSGFLADTFRVYGVEWDSTEIRWYLDDYQFRTVAITDPGMREFHQRFWLLVNLAVGGNWPGSPDSTTVFPQQYLIDWIRVYQLEGYVDGGQGNMILNPGFDYGTDFWGLGLSGGAAGSMDVDTGAGLSGIHALHVALTAPGTAVWHGQVVHSVPIRTGDTLDVSFMAKAAADKNIAVIFQQPRSPYTEYFHQNLTVGTTAARFGPYRFVSTVNDPGAQFKFLVAGNTTELWLDDVQVDLTVPQTGAAVPAAAVPVAGTGFRLPNPVYGFSQLRAVAGNAVQVYDRAGRLVTESAAAPAGVYFYRVVSRPDTQPSVGTVVKLH